MSARLPQLGRRGEGWVVVQLALLAAVICAGAFGVNWPESTRALRLVIAAPIALAGLYLFASALGQLGKQTTPFPKPLDGGSVKRSGSYGVVRHPMYGGVLLLMLAWALASSPLAFLPWAAAAIFLDAKRRREEAWLMEAHPEYDAYRSSVRHSLVPFVW